METAREHCRNCGNPISGEFCATCGQREGRGDLHFMDAAGDLFGDVFTWDSRLWRTLLPLLLRPGFLSAEFIAGRRARYMPPFRLYIVISFLMFLVLSLSAGDTNFVGREDAKDDASRVMELDPDTVPDDLRGRAEAEPAAPDLAKKAAHAEADGQIAAIEDAGNASAESPGKPGISVDGEDVSVTLWEGGPPWVRQLEKRIEVNAERVLEEPSDYVSTLFEYLPQVMFVMLPLFALLLRLFYLFKPFHYLQHLVFALHYHSFVYLLYLLAAGLELTGLHVDGLLSLLLLGYLPLALRRAYGSGWWAALGKSLSLLFSYGIALVLGMATAAVAVLAAM